jgi:N utilization substance protein B
MLIKQKKKGDHKIQSAARLYALQALFQMESSGASVSNIKKEFETYRIGSAEIDSDKADIKLFTEILYRAVEDQTKIDQLTNTILKKTWPLNRIDPTLRALFRAATAEILLSKTPHKVIINEYVEISKAFFLNSKETKLVNAVLDKVIQTMRNIN